MSDLKQFQKHREDCKFKFAPLDVCCCTEKNILARIEALEARIAKADALAEVMEEYSKYTDWFPQKAYGALAAYREADT